jgi:serine/threonine protein kinase
MLAQGHVLNNRYRIVKQIGQGGFGSVYRAWDVTLNRACAIKENTDFTESTQRQFEREAKVLASLRHPNLVKVLDFIQIPGKAQYLVMEYVDGEDLECLLQRAQKVDPARAIDWMIKVCEALTYAHEQNPPIIHRDIKPANIRLTPNGEVVLVDFGLVKVYTGSHKTTQGARAVTPGYSPPEQYGHGTTDARTDVYALAATLYALLTGDPPEESVHRMINPVLPSVRAVNPKVSPKLDLVLAKALDINPAIRYQTIDEFQLALEMEISTANANSNSPSPKSNPNTPGRRSGGCAFSVFAVLLILGLIIALIYSMSAYSEIVAQLESSEYAYTRIVNHYESTQHAYAGIVDRLELTQQAYAGIVDQLESAQREVVDIRASIEATQDVNYYAMASLAALKDPNKIAFESKSGDLIHTDSQYVTTYFANMDVKNFVAESIFINPFHSDDHPWDYGFFFRHSGKNNQFRLIIRSEGYYELINQGDDNLGVIDRGHIPQLSRIKGGINRLTLVCIDSSGRLYVNDQLVSTFDVSNRMNSGDIMIATGIYTGNAVVGEVTPYRDFRVWELP